MFQQDVFAVVLFLSRHLALLTLQEIQSSSTPFGGAFAAILADRSVVTWGDPDFGGDSSGVQDRLRGVRDVQASNRCFCDALASIHRRPRSTVTSSLSLGCAFAAVLYDGSVVTWGSPRYGGDSRRVQEQLTKVEKIQSAGGAFGAAFAALRSDGQPMEVRNFETFVLGDRCLSF